MATPGQPITRAELREELSLLRDELREHYATSEDLAKLETRLAKSETRLTFRMVMVQVSFSVAVVGIVTAVMKLFE